MIILNSSSPLLLTHDPYGYIWLLGMKQHDPIDIAATTPVNPRAAHLSRSLQVTARGGTMASWKVPSHGRVPKSKK